MRASGPVYLIVNPSAGRGRARARATLVHSALEAAQIPVVVKEPGSVAQTVSQAADAWATNARAVVACGGDGTVNQVLQGLMEAATGGERPVLGLVPAGTGNDNARTLGVPVEPQEAAQALVAGLTAQRNRRVDLARVRTGDRTAWFIGVLSTGFDSSVNERANRRRWPSGRAKYILAMLAELGSFQPCDYQVSIDGTPAHGPGMLVAVGNGANYGGGMRICPSARVDDGQLDLTWVGPVSKAAFLRVFPRVFAGTHLDHPHVRALRGTQVTIMAPNQVAYADGERIGGLPVQIELVADALEVVGASNVVAA
jgi:diacylglycerol kinase (ATP)